MHPVAAVVMAIVVAALVAGFAHLAGRFAKSFTQDTPAARSQRTLGLWTIAIVVAAAVAYLLITR